MNLDAVRELIQRAMLVTGSVAAPFLIAVLIVGLLVGVIQAATQVQEQALGFIPKLIVVGIVVVLVGPWAMEQMVGFLKDTLGGMAHMGVNP